MSCELAGCVIEWLSDKLHLRRGVHRPERRRVLAVCCGAVQKCVWFQRVCVVPRGIILGGAWRELVGGVRELRNWVVFGDSGRKQREHMCFVPRRVLLVDSRRKRVRELQCGELLRHSRRERVR